MDAMEMVEMLRARGLDDSQVLQSFFALYINNQAPLEVLCEVANKLNYTVTEEFKNLTPAEQKKKGLRLIKKNK